MDEGYLFVANFILHLKEGALTPIIKLYYTLKFQ